MKKSILFLIIALLVSFTVTYAQVPVVAARQVQKMDNAKVGGTTPMEASAVLEVESTTKGFLLPRMTTQQRTDIATPATGLQVYDTDLKDIWLYNGTAWVKAGGAKFVDGTIPADAVFTGGSVGIGGQPKASAALDITSTTKGVLLPRMTTVERDLIASPNNGLMIYNTTDNAAQVYSTVQQRWGSIGASTVYTYSTTATTPEFSTYKENGTTGTAVIAGTLGQLNFRAWDATRAGFFPSFRLTAVNLAPEANGNIPSSLDFQNHQVGGAGGFTRTSILNLSANGNVGVNNSTPNASAQLDVTSTTRGFLPPRMTTAQMGSIINPAEGLVVYATDGICGKGLRVFDGTSWRAMDNCTVPNATFTFTGGNSQEGDFFTRKVFSLSILNNAVLPINVTTIGKITFTATTVNGYTFAAVLEFPTTGNFLVKLPASGTQTAFNAGGDAFTFTGVGATTQTTTHTIQNVLNGASFTSFSNGTENFSANTTCATKGISTSATCPASVTVGSNTYTAVNINGQCWMQQNLKETPTSPCTNAPNTGCNVWINSTVTDSGRWGYYNITTTNGSAGWRTTEPAAGEGLLYQRSAAMNGSTVERAQGICPSGWHIPSDCEWNYLEHGLGMLIENQNLLTGTLRTSGSVGSKLSSLTTSGTNSSGFTGLLVGFRRNDGIFLTRNTIGYYYTSTTTLVRTLDSTLVSVGRINGQTGSAYSVRCLKDN